VAGDRQILRFVRDLDFGLSDLDAHADAAGPIRPDQIAVLERGMARIQQLLEKQRDGEEGSH
jgi:hypothetical protein